MTLMFGNLSIEQMENRLGIEFPKNLKAWMKGTRQMEVNNIPVKKGHWHCFDTPFTLLSGDRETAAKIYNALKDQGDTMKTRLILSIYQEKN